MTGRSRRGVKFAHKLAGSNGNATGEGRRSSFSDVSEDGSPTKTRGSTSLENIAEVSHDLVAPPLAAYCEVENKSEC